HAKDAACYMACIAMASAAVEVIINRDCRCKGVLRQKTGWAYLNNVNLKVSRDLGLPVAELIAAGESLDSKAPIQFVQRRHKIAHGDTAQLFRTLTDYDPSAKAAAEDQDRRAIAFVREWFNT